ncbi:hypothetical protein COCCADRAFT_83585, partial [Bipolaris zeicola 26-R-13]
VALRARLDTDRLGMVGWRSTIPALATDAQAPQFTTLCRGQLLTTTAQWHFTKFANMNFPETDIVQIPLEYVHDIRDTASSDQTRLVTPKIRSPCCGIQRITHTNQ